MKMIHHAASAALGLLLALPAHAQTNGAVYFGGNAYAYNSFLDQARTPTDTSSGMCSYWYNAPLQQSGSIIASYPNYGDPTTGFLLEHAYVNGSVRLHLNVQGESIGQNIDLYGAQSLSDLGDHHVAISWDTSTNAGATMFIDGPGASVDWSLSSISGLPFRTLVNFSSWTVGAELIGPNFQLFNPFVGIISYLMCRFGDDTFTRVTTAGGILQGPAIQMQDGSIRPLDMGVGCQNVFGTPTTICMQGPKNKFLNNAGYPFADVNGNLVDAATNPFMRWP